MFCITYDLQDIENYIHDNNFSLVRGKGNKTYYNIVCSFDIETTSMYRNVNNDKHITIDNYYKLNHKEQKNYEKIAFMYVFQFLIGDYIYIGRTWEDFKNLCYMLYVELHLIPKRRHLIVYVHNLSYEFQFIKNQLDFIDVFAIKERKPIKAVCDIGIEFKCSYMLSGYSLGKLAENLTNHKVKKLVGDLDYTLIHTPKTQLTNNEIEYCINDVIIVAFYIEECIERFGGIGKIPNTQTGIVRNFVRDKCLKSSEYFYKIKYQLLSVNEFKSARRAFSGGYTHANLINSSKIWQDVSSIDFTSSYPYVMLSEKYPCERGRHLNDDVILNKKSFNQLIKNYLAIFDVIFYDIKSKYNINIISFHKCFKQKDCAIDNGKIINAKMIKMTVTNIDFIDICNFYDFKNCEIGNIYLYENDYLPKEFLQCILSFYNDKTKLKGIEGKEIEYLHSKEMLNSLYGMAVTDICRDKVTFINGSWGSELANVNEQVEKYNTSKGRFLNYLWGVFVTSYARHNLYSGLLEFKNDFIYCDTDSIKAINFDNHTDYIKKYNENCEIKLKKMFDYYDFDYSLYRPKTNKGIEKIIGIWDYEGKYKRFKTLGAKRYLYEDDKNELHLVVSGLGKKALTELKKKYSDDDIFNIFNIGLVLDRGEVGKMTHTYIDKPIEGSVIDYNGIIGEYKENSFIHLEETNFLLSLSDDYLDLLISIGNNSLFDRSIKK